MLFWDILLLFMHRFTKNREGFCQARCICCFSGIACRNIFGLAESVRDDSESVRGDSESVRGDSESVRDDSESVRGDSEFARRDRESVRDDRESTRSDREAARDDRESTWGDAESRAEVINRCGGANCIEIQRFLIKLLINKKLFVYLQPPKCGVMNINYLFTNIYAYNSTISSQRTRGHCREEQVSRVGCLSSEKRSMRTCVHYYT